MRRRVLPAGNRKTIIEALGKHLERRPKIICAYLHGSFLEGGPYRDLDVAVWVDRSRCHDDGVTAHAVDLSAELSLAIGQPVDVQLLNGAPLAFRYHALKGRPLLVRDWEWLDELRARTWDNYFDFLPSSRQHLRELLGREVNLDRLRDLAGHLKNAVRQLRQIGQSPRDVFLGDPRTVNGAKYLLIVATEAALDICGHIVARSGGRSPDCIAILAELGAIDKKLKSRLVKLARFRNLLVHLYWNLDDDEVYRVIRENLGDFDRYLASIGQYLKAGLC